MSLIADAVGMWLDDTIVAVVPKLEYPLMGDGIDELLVEFHVSPAKMVSDFSAEISYYFCRLPPKVTNLAFRETNIDVDWSSASSEGHPVSGTEVSRSLPVSRSA
ncbi:hypothetical protein [Burkholderia gladioli]|uniref:hypothetical protein n=1 Tax=Burkholderia gladioli TaxID=28095 RepID=UPI0016417C01|nr:hypothetical protein [Burkholderia gladioli]